MSDDSGPEQAPIEPRDKIASGNAPDKREAFRAVLYPHRSLGPTGFLILMSAIGGVSFITGMAFLLKGAWPVFGFFGLDVALIYAAFKLNYRSGRLYETVELTPDVLTVTRVHPVRQAGELRLQPLLGARAPRRGAARPHRSAPRLARARIFLRPVSHRRRAPRPVEGPGGRPGAGAHRRSRDRFKAASRYATDCASILPARPSVKTTPRR